MIRTVAFDVDGTLVDLWPAIDAGLVAATEVIRTLSSRAAAVTVDDLRADCEMRYHEAPLTPIHDIRRASFAGVLASVGVDDPAAYHRVCEAFFERRYGALRVYDDVRPALPALRRSYVVGVGSNGNSHLHRCGLAGEFAFEMYAHVDGVPPKPVPEFFARLVALAGVEPGECVYVGDEPGNDVAAARHAGLRTVWLNRSGADLGGCPGPDATITTLAELPEVLAGLR